MTLWPYLRDERYQTRYAVAAFLLRDCPLVVELGGYLTPISDFLRPGQRSIVIDPLMHPALETAEHRRILQRFQDVDVRPQTPYGVCVLGLELHMEEPGWERLYALLGAAMRVVIGVPVDYVHAVHQFAKIMNNTRLEEELVISMDLGGPDRYRKRALHVLRPAAE